ncbi:MAG: oligosaccharide flippase family protein [Chloroflexota bacterium]|nr:oligosaccharide flippase family protein [Chloroflexota bacterium]
MTTATSPESESAPVASTADVGGEHSPRQALLNIVSNYGSLFVSSLTNILLTPVLLSTLGTADYGILRLSQSLFGYLGLLDIGVGSSIIYFVARYHAARAQHELNRYVSTVFNTFLLLAVFAIVVCALAAGPLIDLLGIPPETASTAEWVIRVSAVHFAANLLGGVFGGVLVGRGRYDINNIIAILYLLSSGVGTYVLIRLGYGLLPIVVLTTAAACLTAALRMLWASLHRLYTIAPGKIYRSVLASAMAYGFWSFLNNAASELSFATTDMLILSRFVGISSVAVYSVALAPVALVSQLVFQAVDVFQPTITGLAFRKDGSGRGWEDAAPGGRADVGRAFLLLTKTSIVLGWGAVLLLCLVGEQLLILWIGDIGDAAGELLIALAFAYGWNFVGHAAGLVLLGIARHRLLGVMAIISATTNVVLSVILVQRFGVIGVAFGTIMVMGVTDMIILPRYICRLVALPLAVYGSMIVRAVLCFLASLGVGLMAGQASRGPLGTLGASVLQIVASGPLFVVACWLAIFSPQERALLMGAARGLRRRA